MNSTLLTWLSAWLLVGFTFFSICSSALFGASTEPAVTPPGQTQPGGGRKVVKTDAEWKKLLTADQYAVLRKEGTERAFTSPLNDIHQDGTFYCAACHNPLFSSSTKFDSGTGWPSFYKPITKNAVDEKVDKTFGMIRTEVICNVCGGHLGHVFDDGPKPTGLRYCMNGVAMTFEKK